jgi:ribosomal protein S19
MQRLVTNTKNAGLQILDLPPEVEEEFQKKLFTALRKLSSSRKTRAVHKLIQKNKVQLGIFAGTANDFLGASIDNKNIFNEVVLNLYFFDDSLERQGTVAYATEILRLDKLIRKEETYVDEHRLLKLEKLRERQKETYEKLLNAIDYMKAIDGIYFIWLVFLSKVVILNEPQLKPKIVTVDADILANILKKIFTKVSTKEFDKDVHDLLEAIAIYFINIYYYGETASYSLNKLKQAFREETVEAIARTKVTKFNEFKDLADILRQTELMNITPTLFENLMLSFFGKQAYNVYIKESLVGFTAVMANLSHSNDLFLDAFPVDLKLHARLEELLLNAQKKITIKE